MRSYMFVGVRSADPVWNAHLYEFPANVREGMMYESLSPLETVTQRCTKAGYRDPVPQAEPKQVQPRSHYEWVDILT